MPHNMPRTKFLMIGGFLGAGKTTTIAALAARLQAEGKRVGIVTNDQAYDLVDTHSLRAKGLAVGEVPGACFCCKFDDLVETASQLGAEQQPDVILTEPVGSCTDLVATVIEPLRRLHGDHYELGSLAVLCKPEHGARILDRSSTPTASGGFSPKAEYIFLKQLEEADVVVINKIDKLAAGEPDRLADLIANRLPGKRVLRASGKTGQGLDELLAALLEPRDGSVPLMEVDYDTYAEGEAELAWLNASVTAAALESAQFSLDELVHTCVRRIADNLSQAAYEPAHLKVLGYADGETSIANLVAAGAPAELSLGSGVNTSEATLIVNARVAGDPMVLSSVVDEALEEVGRAFQTRLETKSRQQFRPGRPEPTHRETASGTDPH